MKVNPVKYGTCTLTDARLIRRGYFMTEAFIFQLGWLKSWDEH